MRLILPACLAVAPAEEVLLLECEPSRCAICQAPACAEHDRCHGCGRVVCQRCDTAGGMPIAAFPGDRVPHPHNAEPAP